MCAVPSHVLLFYSFSKLYILYFKLNYIYIYFTIYRYGYQILQTLITDLDPDQRVKNAMNEINSSKRLKYAVAERAEGDKILQVKSAEAGAEALYLSGVGVSRQRKAIVDGLRER